MEGHQVLTKLGEGEHVGLHQVLTLMGEGKHVGLHCVRPDAWPPTGYPRPGANLVMGAPLYQPPMRAPSARLYGAAPAHGGCWRARQSWNDWEGRARAVSAWEDCQQRGERP